MEDSVIFWHSKISSGVLERPIPKSAAEVETAFGRTGPLSVLRGVCQGCPLSPMLFNLYNELIMRHALRSRAIRDAQDRPIDDTDEIRERLRATQNISVTYERSDNPG